VYFHYDDTGLLAEYDASGQLISEYQYQPGNHWMTHPLFKRDGATGKVHYYYNSHLGQPLKLFDKAGRTTWSARSQAFGKVDVVVNETENPLRFPGQYEDGETGLYYNYHRYYDPETGRYLRSDPMGISAGLNSYVYGGSNPLSGIDPLGLFDPNNVNWGQTAVVAAQALAAAAVVGIAVAGAVAIGIVSTPVLVAAVVVGAALLLYEAYDIYSDYAKGCLTDQQLADRAAMLGAGLLGGLGAGKAAKKFIDDALNGVAAIGRLGPGVIRPRGVPESWPMMPGKKPGHIKYENPQNPKHDYVRVKPDGTITQVRNGKAFDGNGNLVPLRSPDAHGITYDKFIFRE
jgi:RHS repeat-associated protein